MASEIRRFGGKALWFLDEIQAGPPALALVRCFHELIPNLHAIAAESLLDFTMREFEYCQSKGIEPRMPVSMPSNRKRGRKSLEIRQRIPADFPFDLIART